MSERKKHLLTLQAGLAGAGMAVSQLALSSGGCSVPNSGRCSACGGCAVVLIGLVSWALWRQSASSSRVRDDA